MRHIDFMETHETAIASKPKRRRITVALSLNAELVRQVDEFAKDAMLSRSTAIEQMLLAWIGMAQAAE